MPDTNTIDARLSALLEPARELLAELDEKIEANRAEHKDLTARRAEVVKVVRALDPHMAAPGRRNGNQPTSQRKATRDPNNWEVSEEKLQMALDFIREHYPNEPFYGNQLLLHPRFNKLMSSFTLSRALGALAERGTIRLDSVDRKHGGRKIYRLTAGRSDA